MSLTTSGASGEIQDAVTTISRGKSGGSSDGNANGTMTAGGQGLDSAFNINAHSNSNDDGTTTRTTRHTAPNSNSLTTVTRTDAGQGSLHSNGTLNSGAATGRDGTASGNTTNDATVTISHQMNGKVGDHTYRFADARGTLIGGQKLGFSAAWDADPEEIHASLVKKASEHTTGTEGERTFYVDVNGVHYSGNTTRQTIDSPDAETLTDTVTDTFWQYDIGLSSRFRRDRTETSTLTAKSGKTDAGDPSRTESIVRTWKETIDDYRFTHEVPSSSPYLEEYTETTTHNTLHDGGTQSKTTTLSGPASKQTAKLDIQYQSTRIEKNGTREHHVFNNSADDADDEDFEDTETTTTKVETATSTYHSEHKVNSEGVASAGTFHAESHTKSTTTTDVSTSSHSDGVGEDAYHGNGTVTSLDDTEGWRITTRSISSDAAENGTYYDRPTGGGSYQRAQTSTFRIEHTDENDDNSYAHSRVYSYTEWDEGSSSEDWVTDKFENEHHRITIIFSGDASPEGGSEKTERSSSDHHDYYFESLRESSQSGVAHQFIVWNLDADIDLQGQKTGDYIYDSYALNEDDSIYDIEYAYGDPFGIIYFDIYINGVFDHQNYIDNATGEKHIGAHGRKTGPAPPGFFSDGAGFLRDPLDWAYGRNAHMSWFADTWAANYVGEGIRITLGDAYLARAGGWELTGVAVGSTAVATIGAMSGTAIAAGYGAGPYVTAFVAGAMGGGSGYLGEIALANVGSGINNGGQVNDPTLSGFATSSLLGGAFGLAFQGTADVGGQVVKRVAEKFAKPRIVAVEPTATPSGKAFTVDKRVVGQLSNSRLGNLAGKISPESLHDLVNSPSAHRFFDTRTGNINIIQELEGKLLRVTVAGDKFKVISVGPIQKRNILNLIGNGGFVPIGPTP